MTAADLDGVVAVAAVAFPEHPEDRACFAERLVLSAPFCFVLEEQGRVLGYLIAYPWREGEIPPLNTLVGALPGDCDTLYLHDLALLPEARGSGRAGAALDLLFDGARLLGAHAIALVSVNASLGFWQAQGFQVRQSPALDAKLASYGAAARYMVRAL